MPGTFSLVSSGKGVTRREADPAPLDRGLDFSMEPPCPREARLPAGGELHRGADDNPPMGPFSS